MAAFSTVLRALMTRWVLGGYLLVEYSSESRATLFHRWEVQLLLRLPSAGWTSWTCWWVSLGKSIGALSLYSPHLPLASIAACTPYAPLCPPLCSHCSLCTWTLCRSLSCLLTSCCVTVSYLSDQATLRSFLFTRSPRWMPKYSKHCGSPFILLPSFFPFFPFMRKQYGIVGKDTTSDSDNLAFNPVLPLVIISSWEIKLAHCAILSHLKMGDLVLMTMWTERVVIVSMEWGS